MPEELRRQDPLIRDLLSHMGVAVLERESLEADDILGTVSRQCEQRGVQALIVSGDRDLFQLAGENTSILYTRRGIAQTERVTPEWIRQTYGVEPAQLVDVKALMGDTSDNIPGVSGVGEKTALRLVGTYANLEAVLEAAETVEKGKLRQVLMEQADIARLSAKLAAIVRDAPLEWDIDRWRLDGCAAR